MCGTGRPGASAKRDARARDDPQAVRTAFVGRLEQQLHAEADAEHRLGQRGISASSPLWREPRHGVGGGADARAG